MNRRFVSIWFPHLATDWFALQMPHLSKRAFVIIAPSHGKMIVTAANPLSEQKGIYPGMALADARAIFPQLDTVDDKPGLHNKLLHRIAAWCIRFTPLPAVDPTGGILLDVTGCAHLWSGEEAYLADILNRLRAKGYHVHAAMADTIGTAWAIARFENAGVVPKRDQTALLSLPPEALRLDTETTERLRKLGICQINALLSIPRTALRRRFGPLVLKRLDQALGKEEEQLQPVFPITPYQERLPCLEPILRIEGIEIALQNLLEQLCKRLRTESKGLRTASFRGYRTDGKIISIEISTHRPTSNTKHLFHLFQLKLSTLEPEPGIELFVLEATHVDVHTPAQEAFWKGSSTLYDTGLSELVDRLTGKLGADVVQKFLPDEHYWPERSFKKAISLTDQPGTKWITSRPRPIHLLPTPERIDVTAPIPDYPPMLFRYKGTLHKIVKADGPERIEQEWWIEEGRHRDYYAVEDAEGCRYWLFRSGHYDAAKTYQWFIHGFFA